MDIRIFQRFQMKIKEKVNLYISCRIIYLVFYLISLTLRVKYFNKEKRRKAELFHKKGSTLFVFWHQNVFTSLATHKNQNITPMVSSSKDGELVAYIAKKIGMNSVRGSDHHGGAEANELLLGYMNNGTCGAFAVDGPKGPSHKVKSGVIALARASQACVLPMSAISDRYWELSNTWDRTKIAKPFSKVVVIYGDPIHVPEDTHGSKFAEFKQIIFDGLEKTQIEAKEKFSNWQRV